MDQTTLFLQNMLLLHLISKLWHLKLKTMASTLRLKLLCPLHPWLWNRTLMSLLQSSLLQHPLVTVLNIWGKGRTGPCWSYEVHPINIFISVSISATWSQYQNSITFISISISISRSWSQSLQLGLNIRTPSPSSWFQSLQLSFISISLSPICFFFFNNIFLFSFNSKIYYKKKEKRKKKKPKRRLLAHLMAIGNEV